MTDTVNKAFNDGQHSEGNRDRGHSDRESAMRQLIMELASFKAPSGSEQEIQEHLLAKLEGVADETWVDVLGNGVAQKHGDGPHIMVTAHADETGLMVIDIDECGFLRVVTVGAVDLHRVVGRHVEFTNGVSGHVGVEADVDEKDLSIDKLYVDIGAVSGQDASSRIRIGDSGVILEPVVEGTEHRLMGRALDNRVGCAIALEAFRQLASEGKNVSVVFSAQQTVGARGVKTAARKLSPDLAIVIDAAPAGDMPSATRMDLRLGEGPALKVMDGTFIIPPKVKDAFLKSAKELDLCVQFEVWPRGLSDAGSIEKSLAGIPTGGISYPARYVGGCSSMVDLRDAVAAVDWVTEIIRDYR